MKPHCNWIRRTVPHLEPTNIEEKLQQGEHRQVEVHIMTGVALSRIQELTTDQTSQEKAVDSNCRHLIKKHLSRLAVFHSNLGKI